MLWNLVGIGVILVLERMFRMRWGKTVAIYFIWYGIGRMMIESIRVDYSEVILGLRSNVFGALVLALIGVVLFIVQTRRYRTTERSIYADDHVWSDEAEAEAETPAREKSPVAVTAGVNEAVTTTDKNGSDESK